MNQVMYHFSAKYGLESPLCLVVSIRINL